jgi:hypothetical protein
VIVIVSVDVPVAFKIRTADGTSINQIEGFHTGLAKDVAVPFFERDRAGGSDVIARTPR